MSEKTFTSQEMCKMLNLDGAGFSKFLEEMRKEGKPVKPMGRSGADLIWSEETARLLRFEKTGDEGMPESFIEFFNRKCAELDAEESAKIEKIHADYTTRRQNITEEAAEAWVLGHKSYGKLKFSELCEKVSEAIKSLKDAANTSAKRLLTPMKKEQLSTAVVQILAQNQEKWMTAQDIFAAAPETILSELQHHWERIRIHLVTKNKVETNAGVRNHKGYRAIAQ